MDTKWKAIRILIRIMFLVLWHMLMEQIFRHLSSAPFGIGSAASRRAMHHRLVGNLYVLIGNAHVAANDHLFGRPQKRV